MQNVNSDPNTSIPNPKFTVEKEIKRIKIVENNYQNNLNSDYTEKIKELDHNFKYEEQSKYYWNPPELSLLYGTPFYEVASSSQKIALNHQFWMSNYSLTAYSEMETIDYNLITADCFSALGGNYKILAEQLEHEAAQERIHIHAFFKVNFQTLKNLLGKQAFTNILLENKPANNSQINLQIANFQYHSLRFLSTLISYKRKHYVSPYFKKIEAKNKLSVTTTNGFFHGYGMLPSFFIRFFASSWGSSPFLASQYYTLRYLANMLLKNQEHTIYLYFKKLQKQGEYVPVPTAISHYHFLDESFHTTTSLFLARDLHKNFPAPTAYEKFLVNWAVYVIQKTNLSHISGVIKNRFFGDDLSGMFYIYKVFRSSLFNLSHEEAVQWVEKCFCQEHEGFHQSVKCHQRLHLEIRKLCENLDYLWPINREMRLMASGGTVGRAIRNNIKTFKQFSKLVASAE
ncbi:hypothetical protein Cylst_6457 (plasmid) [Cylindrospermum stagnale PCC 7417]|uniref:Uncharacterized protein n=1 Tax=Cylindrospermum stagnale PCC 7417 TaxID=56107 RepID=K9X807_9NOST|nr:hypothetical protein [Cylindrospermum stagnale]AFZ28244.1 hypothetical protein Cylst_6457 [Cylindrospermum stagnale PCC 7417]